MVLWGALVAVFGWALILFRCMQRGFEYDEALGWLENGILPGTRWDDIPDDWSCPDCGAAKSDFEMSEVARL